jgi:hypothetical protein
VIQIQSTTGEEIALKRQNILSIFKTQLRAAPTAHKPVSIIIPHRPNKICTEYNINNSYQDLYEIQMVRLMPLSKSKFY